MASLLSGAKTLLAFCASLLAVEAIFATAPLPLEGRTEKLAFATDEGTWLSVDITPDGRQIVFDLLGDLYRLPLEGGEATRLTQGLAYDSQPRISPDGRWIAFVSDRGGADNLWIMRRDGRELRELSANRHSISVSPAWTPDSRYIVVAEGFRHLSSTRLRLYPAAGGSGIDLVDADAQEIMGLGGAFSPDGRFFYFAQRSTDGSEGSGLTAAQIKRLDTRSGRVETITHGMGGGVQPAVSPDGRLLAYGSRREGRTGLRVRDLVTGADRELLWPIQQDVQAYQGSPSGNYLPNHAFAPDGRFVAVSYGGGLHRVDVTTGAAQAIPFTAEISLDVGPDLRAPYQVEQGPVRARIIHHPRLSHDGKRLVMSILTKLYVMEAKAGAPRRLTTGAELEFQPVWSPDGRWIAYVVWMPGTGGHIWRTRADGSGQAQRLTPYPAFYTDIAFSPGGDRIVAMRGGDDYVRYAAASSRKNLPLLDLIWLPASGGEIQLVASSHDGRYPHFADDPQRIYTSSAHALQSERYDGTDRRIHLLIKGRVVTEDNTMPTAERILAHPDGGHALAMINKQVWMVSIPGIASAAAVWNPRTSSVPAARLTDIGADFFDWAEGGKTITWALGSTFYRRPYSSVTAPEERLAGPRDFHAAVEAIEVALNVPRGQPEGTLILRGATVIPMTGPERSSLAGSDIVISGNRIEAVGRSDGGELPEDARIFDLRGKFILPGFIDTHAHWEFPVREIVEPDNWSLKANLAYGVTTGLDVQSNHGEYFAYQDLLEAGQGIGQRAFMSGPAVFGANDYKEFETDFQSYAQTLAYLRRYRQHYRTRNVKSYLVGDRRQRQWLILAAKELGLMPTAEGHGDLKLDITHAIDGMHGNEHALIDSALHKDVIELFARTATAYTPTLNVTHFGPRGAGAEYFLTRTEVHGDPKLRRFYPHFLLDELTRWRAHWLREEEFSTGEMARQAARIRRAGGLVGVGSHGEVQGLSYHWEMWLMAAGGMRPIEILRAATIDGARIIGIDQDLGSIEPGKLADLLVFDANPLDDIRNTTAIRYVIQNGRMFDAELNPIHDAHAAFDVAGAPSAALPHQSTRRPTQLSTARESS